ncbi:MAG: cation:proton antiporter, partial [Acidimicrobiia bacterium]
MEPFSGIPHDDLLKLVFSIAVLLATARLLGEVMRRIGQPVIVGELLAGVLLGPAFLATVFPAFGRLIVPQTQAQSQLLDVVGLIGIMLLILVVGMETDLALIRVHARAAVSIGSMGFVIPFGFGLAVARVFPDDLVGETSSRLMFALFLSVALALSAIPVLAKILSDLRMLRSRFGQIALAAGMFDDILGWTALGIVTSLAAAGRFSIVGVGQTVGSLVVFFAASYWLARPLARLALRFIQDRTRMSDGLLSLLVVFAFAWGAFSQALHLEPVLGAFVAGVIFARQRRLPRSVGRRLESMTMGIFAPIFLAIAGLRLQVEIFSQADLLALTLLLVAVASIGKLVGAFIGA